MDLEKMTVVQLKQLADKKGWAVQGTKKQVIEQLKKLMPKTEEKKKEEQVIVEQPIQDKQEFPRLHFKDSFFCRELGRGMKRGVYVPVNQREYDVLKRWHTDVPLTGFITK